MQQKKVRRLSGTCLCGTVRYEVSDAFGYAANCHCSKCRRTTGSAFKPFAGIEACELAIVKGEADIERYGDETAHNAHCGICGSLLYSLVREAMYVHIAMGTLVDEPSIQPSHHIFVGSKAPWFTITDDLPQFQGHSTVDHEQGQPRVDARPRGG